MTSTTACTPARLLLGASLALAGLTSASASSAAAPEAPPARVHALKIEILSTMLADEGIGEWGFGAIVEVDGHRILFDTGARPTTVLQNARELKVDLTQVPEVVLSHNHSDHTGGLLTLRKDVAGQAPSALARVHVGRGLFWSRPRAGGAEVTFRRERAVVLCRLWSVLAQVPR